MSSLARLRGEGDRRYREHLERLCGLYWRPVCAFIRSAWRVPKEEALDLTQAFFTYCLESGLFQKFDPARGNFRPFLKAAIRNFVRQDHRRSLAHKRGGGVRLLGLGEEVLGCTPGEEPGDSFDREWVREIMKRGIRRLELDLEKRGGRTWFEAFRIYDLGEGSCTYREVSEALGVSEADVRNYLHRARVRLREILIEMVGEYVGSDEEAFKELRGFLKIR